MKKNMIVIACTLISIFILTQQSSAYVMVDIELEASNFLLIPVSGQIEYQGNWSAYSHSHAGDYGGSDSHEAYDLPVSDTYASVATVSSDNYASVPEFLTHGMAYGEVNGVTNSFNGYVDAYISGPNRLYMPFIITGGTGSVDVTASLDYSMAFYGDASSEAYYYGLGQAIIDFREVGVGTIAQPSIWEIIEGVDTTSDVLLEGTLSEIINLQYGREYSLAWGVLGDVTGYSRAIPEPSTILLLGTGLLGVVGIARRRKNQ